MRRQVSIMTLAGLMSATAAVAQQPEFHTQLLKLAVDYLGRAKHGRQPCLPATDAERANPPLPDSQASHILLFGALSANAKHCKLDWQTRSFAPMMSHHRQALNMTDGQMALVGLLHGITMDALEQNLARTPCSPEQRDATEKRFSVR